MKTSSFVSILIVGFLFHVTYLYSIFDIYFRSPLVATEPIVPFSAAAPDGGELAAPARRLVLCVADGLRADKLFEMVTMVDDATTGTHQRDQQSAASSSSSSRAPFLRQVVETRGRWGVSHTRVPTESRPGHVAIIAGFYEDVSAVTKGWKENPVEFDSLFNRSSTTFSFGSPDILPMFGVHVDHVHMEMYDAEFEDFGAANTTVLDQWVFDRVDRMFERAAEDPVLDRQLRARQTVIFLHLLGLDTAGHAKRPYSRAYLDNIRFVDQGIRRLEQTVDRFYGHDGQTAFVFTSDHGMSDQGSHGDGQRVNTETPLIAWGAGLRLPKQRLLHQQPTSPVSVPPPVNWQLDNMERLDVAQADIAPLMATLIGVAIPANSVGVLPTGYLSGSAEFQARALLDNAQLLLAQLRAKAHQVQQSSLGPFLPFQRPSAGSSPVAAAAAAAADGVRQQIDSGQFVAASDQARQLIAYSLDGLHYYQTYDWPVLMTVVTLGYLGWIVFVGLHATQSGHADELPLFSGTWPASRGGPGHLPTAALVFAAAALFLWSQNSPITYYAYFWFPILFWTGVVTDLRPAVAQFVFYSVTQDPWAAGRAALVTLATLELAVAGYFDRRLFGLSMLIMAVWIRPAASSAPTAVRLRRDRFLNVVWFASVLLIALFTCAPLSPGDRPWFVWTGALTLVGALQFVLSAGLPAPVYDVAVSGTHPPSSSSSSPLPGPFLVWSACIVVSGGVVVSTTASLAADAGLPALNQAWSWLMLAATLVAGPVFLAQQKTTASARLLYCVLALSAPFVLLSVAYETLFFTALVLSLFTWIQISHQQATVSPLKLTLSYLLFLYVSFFGTGNVASLSSFEISSTYRFTTLFSPFLMGALLMWKVFTPFIVVAAAFTALLLMRRQSSGPDHRQLFLLVLSLSDVMTVNFFFLIRDEGSWLDIGVSISHFTMSNMMLIFQILLWATSQAVFYKFPQHQQLEQTGNDNDGANNNKRKLK